MDTSHKDGVGLIFKQAKSIIHGGGGGDGDDDDDDDDQLTYF
jgi:hypothetical protein